MDSTVPGITFDNNGECNFCKLHDKLDRMYPLNLKGKKALDSIINNVKKRNTNDKYNCVIGVSGGRDSTYLLYLAKKIWGLKPLAVHFNDGFDNPMAGKNIKNTIEKLGIDLITITSDWRESKDIRIAFLRASVPNLEVGTDLGIINSLYGVAARENIKYVFMASSFRTEGICPLVWNYLDGRYLKSIVNKFGSMKFRKWDPEDPGFNFTLHSMLYYIVFRGIRLVTPMYYVNYVRSQAEEVIKKELDWVYPGAHYFDDLWQSLLFYVYRIKFNADKRKFNYSALVRSGQMTREEALGRIKEVYVIEDPKVIDLCIKRLGVTKETFTEFISSTPKTFRDYPNYYGIIKLLKLPIMIASKLHIIPAGAYDKFFSCGNVN